MVVVTVVVVRSVVVCETGAGVVTTGTVVSRLVGVVSVGTETGMVVSAETKVVVVSVSEESVVTGIVVVA